MIRLSLRLFFLSFVCLFVFEAFGQKESIPPFTPASERLNAFEAQQELQKNAMLADIEFTSIGPTVFSGRVTDIAVDPADPTHFYVAYASGGVWKTVNNGTTFTPIFDDEAVHTIGAIAVDWKHERIWVGTGEVNSSRSSYAGLGVYTSDDDGKSWDYKGLGESHHIGRIILHPTDKNTAWVAVLGHLYSSNPERGVYRTTDGGDNWEKTLFVNNKTGAVEMVIDPQNPDVLYAATWERERSAWNFVESGAGSGIYQSVDGGKTWRNLTDAQKIFPSGEGAGRIGLATQVIDGKTILWASIDNYFRRPKEAGDKDVLTKDALRSMTKDELLAEKDYRIGDYLRSNGFPRKYSVKYIRKQLKSGKITPADLVSYTEDANSLLFDTPVIGLEVYRSENGGQTWTKTHDDYVDQAYNSYGYYFGQMRTSPHDPNRIYILGVPILRSDDGGKTFKNINGSNVHADHHALWVSPDRKGHLILGNDGGINISYDAGETWIKCNSPAVGQFYAIAVDEAEPYNVYGGLQDNGVWVGPSTYKASDRWHGSGRYPYKSIMGGDGMQVAVDLRDNRTVYTGFQFGNYYRLDRISGDRKYISPKHELGEAPLRWNWQTPIHLSIHNQDVLYMGANKLYRSLNQGDDWDAISEDLTRGGRKGDVPYGTLSSIHESPLQFGLLYTGSDDGLVYRSRDGGYSWTKISDGLPQHLWVSRVQASQYAKGRVYLSLNGYRWDDARSLIYVSEDYGDSWTRIGTQLPAEAVNVIKEDPENEDLLYVGTDHGLYVSLDRGQNFMLLQNGLPAVSVHDVVVQPTAKELVVGTHGRSIYKASVKELQQMNTDMLTTALHVFKPASIRYWGGWGAKATVWRETPEPEVLLPVFSAKPQTIEIEIVSPKGLSLTRFNRDLKAGLNYLPYDLTYGKKARAEYEQEMKAKQKDKERPFSIEPADNGKLYLKRGTYEVIYRMGRTEKTTSLEVK